MELEKMIEDFCARAETDYTLDQVKIAMENNYSLIVEDGFAVFNIVQNELHCLFCYVRPGNKELFKLLVQTMELFGKYNGCTKAKFITRRDKPFARVMKEYSPCAVMFEKELV